MNARGSRIAAAALCMAASSCRLFGVGIPCASADNCPGGAQCVDGFCGGAPGGGPGGAVGPIAGRSACASADDCGGDACGGDGKCKVTAWLTADATLFDLRATSTGLAFSLSRATSIADPCALGTGVGVAARDQAPGATFDEHTGECGIGSFVASDDVVAWDDSRAGSSSADVRALQDGVASTVASVSNALAAGVAVSGARVLWLDDGKLHAADAPSATLTVPVGFFGSAVLAADADEVWAGADSIVVAPADPAHWPDATTFPAPDGAPDAIALGATRAFFATPVENGQTRLSALARTDGSVTPVDLLPEGQGVDSMATAGDNLFAVEGTTVVLYPADGSPKVELTTGQAPFGIAYADGFVWWTDGGEIDRVRVSP